MNWVWRNHFGVGLVRTPDDLAHHVLLHESHGLWPLFMEKVFAGRPGPRPRSVNFSQTSLAVKETLP